MVGTTCCDFCVPLFPDRVANSNTAMAKSLLTSIILNSASAFVSSSFLFCLDSLSFLLLGHGLRMLCSEDQLSKHLKLFLQPSLGLRAHQIAMLLLPRKKTIFKKNELLCWVDFVLKESCALSLVSKHKALAFLSMPASHRSECCLNVERTCNVSSVHVPLTFFKQSRSCGQLLGVGFESLRPLPTSGAFILELACEVHQTLQCLDTSAANWLV